MDALSRIGEFFWDDGRLTHEERQLAAQRYKERILKKKKEKQGAKKKRQPKSPKEKKRVAPVPRRRGRSKQSRRTHKSIQRRRRESRNDSVSSSSPSEDDYSDGVESMEPEDLQNRTFSSRSKSVVSSDLTRESGTSRSSSMSRLRTRTRSLQRKMGLRLGVRKATTESIRQGADDESEAETATGSISADTNTRKRRVMDQLMEVISSDDDDDDSEISRSTSSSQESPTHSSSHANSRGRSKYDHNRSRTTNASDNTPQLPVDVTAATSHGGFETGINDVSSTAARADMERDWQSMTTRSTKTKTISGDWIEYVDEDAAIELAIESSPSSEADDSGSDGDEDEDEVEEESEVDDTKFATNSPSSPHNEASQAPNPPENFTRKPSVETMQTMDTRARRIKALFPPKFSKKNILLSQLRPSLPSQLPKATAKTNVEPALPPKDSSPMHGRPQTLQSSGGLSDDKHNTEGKSKKKEPQRTNEDDSTDDGINAFSEAIAQMNKIGTSQDHAQDLKTHSSSSRSRSLPVQSSQAFKPYSLHKVEVSGQLSTADLAENPTNSTTGTTGMKENNSLLKMLSNRQSSNISKTGSQADKTVQSTKSNAAAESVPTKLTNEVQEIQEPGGSEKDAAQRMASPQSAMHTPDTSKNAHEVPISSNDAFGNSIPQNGATEYPNSDDDDDLHEFIEVAYDPQEDEGSQRSPIPSPLSAITKSFSRATQDQSERPLSPVGNIIMSNNLNLEEIEPLEKQSQKAKEGASPQKKKSFFGSLFLRRKKKCKASQQRESPNVTKTARKPAETTTQKTKNENLPDNLAGMDNASVEPSPKQSDSIGAKGKDHPTRNPLRKRWVKRSFSVSRKKQEQCRSAEQNKEQPDGLAEQATPADIPSIQTRLPSMLPLPHGTKADNDGVTTDIQVETPTVANSILAGAASSDTDNPWGAIGHPSYLAPKQGQQNTDQAGPVARPEDLSQMMTKKLLEEREPSQVEEERRETVTPGTQPVNIGRDSNVAEPHKEAKSLKPKKGLGKFRGMLRWNSKSTKQDQALSEAEELDVRSTDLGQADANDDANDDELRTQPEDSVVPGGAETTASSSKDETFLKQHQMMMQSANPHWMHPQPQAPAGEDLPSSSRDTEGQTPAGRAVNDTPETGQTTLQRVLGGREKLKNGFGELVNDAPEEKGQTKLQRVLGEREKQKKAARLSEPNENSTLDARIPEEQLAQHLREILENMSSTTSCDSADDESNAETQDFTQTSLCQETVDDSTMYSVQNQRVLDTLRLLHAVKRKKQLKEGRATNQAMTVRNCNAAVIEPLIDGLEDYVETFN